MSGRLKIQSELTKRNKHDHLISYYKNSKILVLNDPRKFGFIDFSMTSKLKNKKYFIQGKLNGYEEQYVLENKLDKEGKQVKDWNGNSIKNYYMEFKGSYKEGSKEGKHTYYHPNKKISRVENYKKKNLKNKNLFLLKYLTQNVDKKSTNNIGLVEYFDKYQAFCFDLRSDSVLKGDLNFNYE